MISEAVIELIKKEPFFAKIILNMRRSYSTRIPTAGVSITEQVNLIVNPNFWATLTLLEQVAVLRHECFHLIFNHIGRGKVLGKFDKKMNIAADLAINQMIDNLPAGALTIEMFRKDILDIEPNKTMEYYYSKIKDLEGYETLDDHSEWDKVDSEYARQKIKELVDDAVSSIGIGKVPGNMVLAIKELRNSKKNWKNELQRFVSKQNETLLEQSRKVRNRRYGILYPGYKKVSKLTIAVAVDTSGSISDEALLQFFGEIAKIHKSNVDIKIIECDSNVRPAYDYDPKKKIEVHGRGGTAFQPVFDEANTLEIDGLIYFTDGDAFDTPTKPKYPVLWAIVGDSKKPVDFGAVTRVEVA